jgi:hypothetical protein
MDGNDLQSLARVLAYGSPATRRSLAERMAADPNPEVPRVLMATVRSSEPEIVRDRCLEILGIMAAAGHTLAATILGDLNVPF